jgi:ADP-ribosylation factor related protein 1
MYTLISGFYQEWTRKEIFNVLVLGVDNAGKTSFVSELAASADGSSRKPFIIPTVGLNVTKVSLSRRTVAQCWDLGGQSGLRSLWEHYFAEAHALVFVIDGADVDRLTEARAELVAVLQHPLLTDIPLAVVTNKQDKPGAHSAHAVMDWLAVWELLSPSCVFLPGDVLRTPMAAEKIGDAAGRSADSRSGAASGTTDAAFGAVTVTIHSGAGSTAAGTGGTAGAAAGGGTAAGSQASETLGFPSTSLSRAASHALPPQPAPVLVPPEGSPAASLAGAPSRPRTPHAATAYAGSASAALMAAAAAATARHDFIALGASARNRSGVDTLLAWLAETIPTQPRTARLTAAAAAKLKD